MLKSPKADLTRREGQIMDILYRRRRATVEEVRAELPDPPGSSSVRKLLEILIERGHVDREYDGPRFVYFPTSKPEQVSPPRYDTSSPRSSKARPARRSQRSST